MYRLVAFCVLLFGLLAGSIWCQKGTCSEDFVLYSDRELARMSGGSEDWRCVPITACDKPDVTPPAFCFLGKPGSACGSQIWYYYGEYCVLTYAGNEYCGGSTQTCDVLCYSTKNFVCVLNGGLLYCLWDNIVIPDTYMRGITSPNCYGEFLNCD